MRTWFAPAVLSGADSGTTYGIRAPQAAQVPLRATIAEDRLRAYLQTNIAPRYDQSSTPAQPIAGTPNYTHGTPSQTLDIDRAVPLIDDALQSSTSRVAVLSFTRPTVARPSIQDLGAQLKQIISTSGFDGTLGLYMLDLQSGQEIHFALNQGQSVTTPPDVSFTAASTIKIPVLVSYFIQHGKGPVDDATSAIIENMIHQSSNPSTDDLMAQLDPDRGPLIVTEDMQKLGLKDTFIAGFFKLGAPSSSDSVHRQISVPTSIPSQIHTTKPLQKTWECYWKTFTNVPKVEAARWSQLSPPRSIKMFANKLLPILHRIRLAF